MSAGDRGIAPRHAPTRPLWQRVAFLGCELLLAAFLSEAVFLGGMGWGLTHP